MVWIAGGLAKGSRFEQLVADQAHTIKAAVIIGKDQQPMLDAFAASAPDIPMTVIDPKDNDTVMARAVDAAGTYAAIRRRGAHGSGLRLHGPVQVLRGSRKPVRAAGSALGEAAWRKPEASRSITSSASRPNMTDGAAAQTREPLKNGGQGVTPTRYGASTDSAYA